MKRDIRYITHGAAIAALYVALTLVSAAMGLSSGAVQFRLSEALCVLPLFTPAAVPGLTIGCFAANLITGAVFWDVLFGSLATFAGAALAYRFRTRPGLAPLFTILSNGLTVPLVLRYAYGLEQAYIYLAATVLLGEAVCCGLLGTLLRRALERRGIPGGFQK